MQQLDCETGQDWKIAALNKIIVCTIFLTMARKDVCMFENNLKKTIIKKIKKLNKKALKSKDVPVSCIIVKNNKIIAQEYNKKNKKNNPIAHAEILAIVKAAKRNKTWNLNDCELYVSMEPCNMCKAVLNEARIKKVYYILEKKKNVNDTTTYEMLTDAENKYFLSEIKEFFINKR